MGRFPADPEPDLIVTFVLSCTSARNRRPIRQISASY